MGQQCSPLRQTSGRWGGKKDDEEMSQQHGGDVHCNREQAFGTWGEVEERYAMWGPHIIERRGLELVGLD